MQIQGTPTRDCESQDLQICMQQAPEVEYDAGDLQIILWEKLAEAPSWEILSKRSKESNQNATFKSPYLC